MFARFLIIIALTFGYLTYLSHHSPQDQMFIYAGALAIVFPIVEIVAARSNR